MPPKPAREASKGPKKKAAPVDPVEEIKAMENIHEVLAKAQELRNYFQVERDRVNQMWQVTQKELENESFNLNHANAELEEMVRVHQVEMTVYKQKVRHLLYDHKVAIKQLKDKSDAELQQAEVAHDKRMADIEEERQRRLKDIQSSMKANEGLVLETRDSHQYMTTVTKKQNHEKELARLRASYEAKVATLREDLELRRRAEINDVEERRDEHINHLVRQHEEKFAEMKTYYNNITKNNLEIIKSIKDEIATMKQNDEHNERLMYDIEKENHNLVTPLDQAQREVEELQQKKKQHLMDKQSLGVTRARYAMLRRDLKKLREEHESLQTSYEQVHDERERLKASFETSLREAMDVVEQRNAVLQHGLLEANAQVEERDAQFAGVLQAMNLEPAAMSAVSHNIDEELELKNQIIKDLHFELRKMESKTHRALLEYERRCRTAGVAPLARENFG